MGKLGIYIAAAILLCGCIAPEENIDIAQLDMGGKNEVMPPLIPVGPSVGGPFATIDCPVDGANIVALDIRRPVAALLRNDELQSADIATLDNEKVDRAGDDNITGRLSIAPAGATAGLVVSAGPASDQNAIQATGNGIGPAIIGTGGANGVGASFTAGGGNNFGARGIGSGNEVGIEGTGGASGSGVRARAGTAATFTVPTYSLLLVDGGFHMEGVVSPNANVNPGFDFAQFPQNTITSRAKLRITGGVLSVVNNQGFNVASFTQVGGSPQSGAVTFVRNLPGLDYSIHIDTGGANSGRYRAYNNGAQNVNNFQFNVWDSVAGADVADISTITVDFFVSTVGY